MYSGIAREHRELGDQGFVHWRRLSADHGAHGGQLRTKPRPSNDGCCGHFSPQPGRSKGDIVRRKRGILQNGVFVDPARGVATVRLGPAALLTESRRTKPGSSAAAPRRGSRLPRVRAPRAQPRARRGRRRDPASARSDCTASHRCQTVLTVCGTWPSYDRPCARSRKDWSVIGPSCQLFLAQLLAFCEYRYRDSKPAPED